MAAVLSTSPLLDPSRLAKVPLTLGSELTNSAGTNQRNVNVQWNYKPPPQTNQSAKVRRSGRSSDTRVDLTLKDPNAPGEFQYTGTQQPSGSYALIYHPSTQAFVLEKLDIDFTFNLQTTPSNHDRSQVTSQYPQLDIGISDAESDEGSTTEAPAAEGIDASEADANNPYDYRHFLKRRRTPSPEAPITRPSVSPAVPPRRLSRTTTKPKPRPRPQQRPKRPIHQDANANSEDSDDGGLTIEMGDDPKRRRFGSGAVVFNHDKRNGPISLRSAASSMSPASIRHESGNEEAESDNDVEQLELPSPQTRPSHEAEEGDHDEDDDDLVEDLMQAMESQEEEDVAADQRIHNESRTIQRAIEESSSSSEEE